MKRCVVDTNVPIVANGRPDPEGGRTPSLSCRIAAIEALEHVLKRGRILLDLDGAIQEEYRRHLNPRGQPGVGDRFYLEVINSMPRLVERLALPKTEAGEYADFPADPELATFDRSDRKFAALARREGVPVMNATDSDWIDHRGALQARGISVDFLCGCARDGWFAS